MPRGCEAWRTGGGLGVVSGGPSASERGGRGEVGSVMGKITWRVDVEVEGAAGAFALKEWLRSGGPVLLKSSQGPLLADDPWRVNARPHMARAA